MPVHEPLTLATDYALALAAAIFGARLWRVFRPWSLTLFFTAAGAFFGGTFHGFGPELAPVGATLLWKATMISIALASFFLLSGCGRVLRWIGLALLVAALGWMATHDHFGVVLADYGIALLLVAGAQMRAWMRSRAPSAPWYFASLALSIVAAVVQQAPVAYHNDIYHVIQIAALWLLYRAGALMTSSTARPTIRPT